MEETSQEPLISLNVDYDSGNALKETARWTKFISIVFMICIVIFLVVMLFAATALNVLFSSLIPSLSSMVGGAVIVIIIFVLGVFGFTSFLLYRFSTLVKKGIEMQDQELFNKGLSNLRIYFIINGVIAILSLLSNFSTLIKQLLH